MTPFARKWVAVPQRSQSPLALWGNFQYATEWGQLPPNWAWFPKIIYKIDWTAYIGKAEGEKLYYASPQEIVGKLTDNKHGVILDTMGMLELYGSVLDL